MKLKKALLLIITVGLIGFFIGQATKVKPQKEVKPAKKEVLDFGPPKSNEPNIYKNTIEERKEIEEELSKEIFEEIQSEKERK